MIKCVLKVGVLGELCEREIAFEYDETQESLGIVVMELGSKIMDERYHEIAGEFSELNARCTNLYNEIHFDGVHPNSKSKVA